MIELVVHCGMSIILEILSSFCSASLIVIVLRIYNNIKCFCFCCYVINANLYLLLKNIRFLSLIVARAPQFLLPGGQNLKKGIFLLKRHCQQNQILVVMLQFETLVDMIEFQFALDRPASRKSFILLICFLFFLSFPF